jgi:stage V sporulation protein SpoVS
MRIENLPSPGILSSSLRLRTEATKAINAVEIVAGRTPGGKTIAAGTLATFFTACASAIAALSDVAVVGFASVTSATAASATQLNIVFPESMDQTVVPAPTAFAISGDTITAVAWVNATTLRLTGTGFASGESLVYTKPATNALRDRAGNQTASGTKVTV